MEFRHKSVLLEESIEALHIRPDGIYVDGTLGGGGLGDPLRLPAFPNGRYADHCRRTYRYGPIYPVTRRLLFQKA